MLRRLIFAAIEEMCLRRPETSASIPASRNFASSSLRICSIIVSEPFRLLSTSRAICAYSAGSR